MNKKDALVKKLSSKSGRAAAINAKCCDCIYDPADTGNGSWRKQVENCAVTDCPLYEYRPRTIGGNSDDDEGEE